MAAVKYASKCKECGAAIAPGTGDVRKVGGKWATTCDEHAPKATTSRTYGAGRTYGRTLYDSNQRRTGHHRGCACKKCEWDEC
jgi:hypothetical protein